jgi:hypothetical protein
VTDAEAEIGYYQGDGLLLEDVLREQVLLALPLESDLPRRLPRLVPALRQEFERGTVFLHDRDGRSAVDGAARNSQQAGTLKTLSAVSSQLSASAMRVQFKLKADS